jgi:molybdopterin biosynthesis enzyme MoaB
VFTPYSELFAAQMRMASEDEIEVHKLSAKQFFFVDDEKLIFLWETNVSPA